jgi:hypothetical protein
MSITPWISNAGISFTSEYSDYFSSIRIVGPYKITVYENYNRNEYLPGRQLTFSGDVPSLLEYNFDNTIDSAKLEFRDKGVYLFEDENYNGRWVRVTDNNYVYNETGNIESYNAAEYLGDRLNDRFSSLKIAGNYQITIYQHSNCNQYENGFSSLVIADTPRLSSLLLENGVSSADVDVKGATGVYLYTRTSYFQAIKDCHNTTISFISRYIEYIPWFYIKYTAIVYKKTLRGFPIKA